MKATFGMLHPIHPEEILHVMDHDHWMWTTLEEWMQYGDDMQPPPAPNIALQQGWQYLHVQCQECGLLLMLSRVRDDDLPVGGLTERKRDALNMVIERLLMAQRLYEVAEKKGNLKDYGIAEEPGFFAPDQKKDWFEVCFNVRGQFRAHRASTN